MIRRILLFTLSGLLLLLTYYFWFSQETKQINTEQRDILDRPEIRELQKNLNKKHCPYADNDNFDSSNINRLIRLGVTKFCGVNIRYYEPKNVTYNTTINFQGAKLIGAKFNNKNIDKLLLDKSNLTGAELVNANIQKTKLFETNFSKADLRQANLATNDSLNNINFNYADLRRANFNKAVITAGTFHKAELAGTNFAETTFSCLIKNEEDTLCPRIDEAIFVKDKCYPVKTYDEDTNTNIEETYCDPKMKSYTKLKGAKGIKNLSWNYEQEGNMPHSLYPLRKYHRDNGFIKEANDLTYVIEYGKIQEKLAKIKVNDNGDEKNQEKLAKTKVNNNGDEENQEKCSTEDQSNKEKCTQTKVDRIEYYWAYLSLYLFEKTVKFGVEPLNAITLMMKFTVIFALLYSIVLVYQFIPNSNDYNSDLLKVIAHEQHSENTIRYNEGEFKSIALITTTNNTAYNYFKLSCHAIWFSILSAFHFGWRDLNIGNWLARIQLQPFTYRPQKIMRFLSGIQSLICIYLLAIFFLTQFGHPWG